LTNSIRNRITKLNDQNKRSVQGDPNFNTRKLQIANLQNSFKRALEEYNLVEKRSRDKYRQRMERQIKIGELSSASSFCSLFDAEETVSVP
jgi:syntaxin 1B/2/3